MQMQRVLFLLQIVPIAASLIGATAFSGYAAEIPLLVESDQSMTDPEPFPIESIPELVPAEPRLAKIFSLTDLQSDRLRTVAFAAADNAIAAAQTLQLSSLDRLIDTETVEQQPEMHSAVPSIIAQPVTQTETNDAATHQWQISNHVILNSAPQAVEDEASHADVNIAATSNTISSLSESESESELELELEQSQELGMSTLAEDLGQAQFTPSTASAMVGDLATAASSGKTQVQFITIAQADLEQMISGDWQIAQAEPAHELETPQAIPEAEGSSASPHWRFSIIPYAFVPLSINGSVTVRNFSADLNLGLDDILEQLNFALAGRVEAWRGNLGLIFDAAYFDLGQDRSINLSVPNCLCNVLPSRIDTEINVQYGQFDLGVGYRYGTNLSSAATEFEMGELVLDAVVGVRIYTLNQEIDISTNLGNNRDLQSSTTLLTPLASGRIRWNLSPTLAGWVRGDIAGFGIGGTLFATSWTAGIDWLFAGNTSLLLAYRFSTLQYNTDVQGEELGLNLLLHGPYVGMVFRF